MVSDEQRDERRVRTMCGWIGVEISRSRVRTPGRPSYGLYRVRGGTYEPVEGGGLIGETAHVFRQGEWTGYLFDLESIELAVTVAISGRSPAGPADLVLYHPSPKIGRDRPAILVPTRWTSAYRGPRGDAVVPGRSLGEVPHDPARCHMDGQPHLGPCIDRLSSVRSRQREANAAFQADHLERRRYGKDARHARRLGQIATERGGGSAAQRGAALGGRSLPGWGSDAATGL